MSSYGGPHSEMMEHRFCLGTSSFAGAPALHVLLGKVAPPQADGTWYSRSPLSESEGRAYMSIFTYYHDNLSAAVSEWQEPEVSA